ncbi:MAG: VOC family protein [Fimbriimonas sp.]|nr:VOC family protein [Fimbriimonas sp.]
MNTEPGARNRKPPSPHHRRPRSRTVGYAAPFRAKVFDMGEPVGMKVDHVGIVVADIDAVADEYAQVLGGVRLGGMVHDPMQKVDIQFLGLPDGSRIELIRPAGSDSPVAQALAKGGGLNHICYEVPDIERAIREALSTRALCVCPPTPAVAFGGRRVAFLFTKHIGLFEFVEQPGVGD